MCCPAELRGADRHADACADHPGGRPRRHHRRADGRADDGHADAESRCAGGQGHQLHPGAIGRAVPPLPQALPCIRCTRCADVCPAELQPQELFRFAKAGDFGRAQEYHLFDCIECGCCSYVCPSHIPLVDFYRYAKGEIWTREKDKRAADLARERHAFRQFRQEREKKEKARSLPPRPRPSAPSLPPRPTPAAPRPAKPMPRKR